MGPRDQPELLRVDVAERGELAHVARVRASGVLVVDVVEPDRAAGTGANRWNCSAVSDADGLALTATPILVSITRPGDGAPSISVGSVAICARVPPDGVNHEIGRRGRTVSIRRAHAGRVGLQHTRHHALGEDPECLFLNLESCLHRVIIL